jgi:AGCS family alanine or glycine:cation symporter
MLGPILDTILVCTITGLIIIISGAYLETDLNGIVYLLRLLEDYFLDLVIIF